jgi:DNA-directed RNA polymerase subunit RPC12/RpoP
MPVRFRCAYCNQLLGIARRKSGSIVRCPTCSGQVVVPTVESMPVEQPAGAVEQPVFERSDFDELLGTAATGGAASAVEVSPKAPMPVAPMGAWGTHAEPAFDMARLDPSASLRATAPPGIVLSPTKATIIAVVAIVLIGVAFGAGVVVGRFVLGS